MDALPDDLMPLVWQDAYTEAFADAVGRDRGVTTVAQADAAMISSATHRATLAG